MKERGVNESYILELLLECVEAHRGHSNALKRIEDKLENILADIDTLNAALAAVQTDENAEDTALTSIEAVGASIEASITILQNEVAAGTPNLAPAIAAAQALKAQNDARLAKLQADLASGTTYEGTLPQPPAPAPSTPPAASS
jgi:septal ring factor EnvC (AmiA/AmiB activator)